MRLLSILFLPAAILACAGIEVSCASESQPVDVRLNLVVAPPSDSITATYSYPDYSGGTFSEDNLNPGMRFELGLATRLTMFNEQWSLVGGLMLFYSNQESSDFQEGERSIPSHVGPIGMTTLGADIFLALNLKMSPYLDAELGPFVGLGSATLSDKFVSVDGPIGEESGHGDYEEAGVGLSFIAHNAERSFLFAFGVRYYGAFTEADLYYDVVRRSDGQKFPNGLRQHIEIRQSGFAPSMTVGLTF